MKSVDEIYLGIGNSINESIPVEFKVATLKLEFYGTACEFESHFIDRIDVEHDFEVDYLVFKLFQELHAITSEGNPWNIAVYKLKADGEFTIYFEYDEDIAIDYKEYNGRAC